MTDIPQTRRSLLLELGKHSDDAWAEFLEVYENAIYRLCRGRGLQDADARDVTQEVLAAVHQRIPSWDLDSSRGSFRSWLFRVARNISVDRVADRSREAHGKSTTQVDRLLRELPEGDDQESEFDVEYRRSLLAWATDKVKSEVREVTWQAFHKTAVEGLQAPEVAKQLNVPIGSVYTAKCRVVARIRSKVDELEGRS